MGQGGIFEGKLSVKHSIRIDGRLKGELETAETVTIGSNGEVEGDIKAKDVIVGGKITGSIIAGGRVTLESTSTFNGDVKTVKLVIEEGAVFNGAMEMIDSKPVTPARKLNFSEEKSSPTEQ